MSKPNRLAILSPSIVLTSAYAITGVLPQLKAGLSLSQGQAEYLVTTPSIVVLVMVLLSPWLQRWFGRTDKQMIMAGLAIIGLAGMAPLVCHTYLAILIARIFLGLGIGLYNAQAISIIADWYQGKGLSLMLGWHAAAEELGQALTVSLASLLLIIGGWRQAFWAYGLAWLVLAFFTLKVPNDRPTVVHQASDNNGRQGKLNARVFALMIMALFLLTAYVAMENRFPALAVHLNGAHYTGSGKFLSLMLIGSTLGGLTYGWLADQLGHRLVYLALGLLALADFTFYFGAHHFALIALAIMMQGFPLQLISPWIFNQLSELVPPEQRSFANSVVLVGFNLGAFISPSVTMALNHLLGQPVSGTGLAAPFIVYACVIILIAAFLEFGQIVKKYKEV